MGSKIEYILIAAIAFVALLPLGIKISNKSLAPKKLEQKSSEINNFTEFEINSTNLQHTLKAKSAEEINEKWYLKEPNVTTDKIKSLSSKRSIADSNKIEFFDKVVAKKVDGTIYRSEHAIYDLKKKKLDTPKKFTIKRGSDIVRGVNLQYDVKSKVTRAKDVNGTFKLKEKK